MKTKLIILLFLVIGISSCRKNRTTYSDSGTLTGFDPRLCACCGGIFLESDNSKTYHMKPYPA